MTDAMIDLAGNPPLTPAGRKALVEANLRLVPHVANRWFGAMLRSGHGDNLLAEGRLALVEAAAAYDPAKGTPFAAFATQTIRFGMLDECERTRALPVPVSQLACDPLEALLRDDLRAAEMPDWEAASAALPPRSREFVRLRLAGETLEQIGERHGLSRERVRQVLVKAYRPLRRALARQGIGRAG